MAGAFLWNLVRHRTVTDDAFISYRYARHLVEGHGLVWNVGERVEGYTNFLWVMIEAAGLGLGMAPERLAPSLGIASGFAVLAALAWVTARERGFGDPLVFAAPMALAVNRSFAAWSSSGLETSFFTLLAVLGSLALIRELDRDTPRPWLASLILGLAALTRPEGVLFFAVGALALVADARSWRRAARSFSLYALPFIALFGGHMLWRYAYYGFWLPNTFYAKVSGLWWEQSAFYFELLFATYPIAWLLPLLPFAMLSGPRATRILMIFPVPLWLGYLVAVGADYLEFRFMVPLFPFLCWGIVEGGRSVAAWLAERASAPRLAFWGSVAVGFALPLSMAVGSLRPAVEASGITSIEAHGGFTEFRISQGRELRELIREGVLPRELRIQTDAVGALPYFTGWYTFDSRGLNDLEIARKPLRERGIVGHEHGASVEETREREIDAVIVNHQMLYDASDPSLARAHQSAWLAVDHTNRAFGAHPGLRVICREIGGDRAILFATVFDDARVRDRFGDLAGCRFLGARKRRPER